MELVFVNLRPDESLLAYLKVLRLLPLFPSIHGECLDGHGFLESRSAVARTSDPLDRVATF